MNELLRYLEHRFYITAIAFLFAVVGLTISIWKGKKNRKLKPLFFFFLGYVLNESTTFFGIAVNMYRPLKDLIFYYSDFVDTIIEFLAFFFLIKNHVFNIQIKKALNPLLPIFIVFISIYCIYYKIYNEEIDQYFLQTIFTFQALFLIIACLLYYIDLFKKEPKSNLVDQPSFWAVTGLAFFMLCTLPLSVFELHLAKTNIHLYIQLFFIFEVFYCILFLMSIKAYLCKPIKKNIPYEE